MRHASYIRAVVMGMTERQRIQAIEVILEGLTSKRSIAKIRALVAGPRWDGPIEVEHVHGRPVRKVADLDCGLPDPSLAPGWTPEQQREWEAT